MSSKSSSHTSYWFYKASCLFIVQHPNGSIVYPKPLSNDLLPTAMACDLHWKSKYVIILLHSSQRVVHHGNSDGQCFVQGAGYDMGALGAMMAVQPVSRFLTPAPLTRPPLHAPVICTQLIGQIGPRKLSSEQRSSQLHYHHPEEKQFREQIVL